MLKRLLQSCAAAALMASPVMAVDVAGTFTAQTTQGPLSIELRPDQGRFTGTVHFAGKDFPIVACQSGNEIVGVWQAEGQPIPLNASFDGTTLTLNTNGATYSLQRGADVLAPVPGNVDSRPADQFAKWQNYVDGVDAPQPEPTMQPPNVQPQPIPQPPAVPQAEIQQGQVFRYALPAGWRANETANGVDMLAPDGATVVSHTLLQGPGQSSPDRILQMFAVAGPQTGITGMRVLSARPTQNGQTTTYELSYQFNGALVQAVAVFTVVNQWGGYMADMVLLQGPAQTLGRDLPAMAQLAQSVVVTDGNRVAGNDQLLRFQPPAPISPSHTGSSNPVGDMIVQGEQARNRVRDQIFQRDTDVRREQSRWQIPGGGTVVTPNDAARAFITPGGTATYSTRQNTPPPPNSTELNPYTYGH